MDAVVNLVDELVEAVLPVGPRLAEVDLPSFEGQLTVRHEVSLGLQHECQGLGAPDFEATHLPSMVTRLPLLSMSSCWMCAGKRRSA
jgi:hypothetical protein